MNVRRARRLAGLLALAATAAACEAVVGLDDFTIVSPDGSAPDGAPASSSASSSSGSVEESDGAVIPVAPDSRPTDAAMMDAARDAEAGAGPEAGTIQCSSTLSCKVPELCCSDDFGFEPTCGTSCTGNSYACDDDSDCTSGNVCCYGAVAAGFAPNKTACMPSCTGNLMPTCTNKPCPSGQTCGDPTPTLPDLKTCR